MVVSRLGKSSMFLGCSLRSPIFCALRPQLRQIRGQIQIRAQHNKPKTHENEDERKVSQPPPPPPRADRDHVHTQPPWGEQASPTMLSDEIKRPAKTVVYYLRPAIWAVAVSGGIFIGLAYLEAKKELKARQGSSWLQTPQWGTSRRSAPTPTEVATTWWTDLNPISKLSYSIIAANGVIHASSFVAPRFWESLWHQPARNVNYTQFTSMFVHSGALHIGLNMYCLNNFMLPVGYSRLFDGSWHHTLSFYLATGVLSGFAQHWSTLIPIKKRAVPEIFIRCGGASGALFGILAVFCMQYPTAGLGIMFVPVHFDAQYVLPAIMLFDLVGMVRGFSFVNFGHAAHFSGAVIGVAYSQLDGKNRIWKPLVGWWKRRLHA